MKIIAPEEALQKARNICSKQEKCKSDIATKLRQWDIADSDIETIIETLESQNYIDEKRFAENYVNTKIKITKWGKTKIEYMLQAKQVPNNFINNALEQVEDAIYLDMIATELLKKAKTIRSKSGSDLRTKLFAFSQNRGYESEIFNRLIPNFLEEH